MAAIEWSQGKDSSDPSILMEIYKGELFIEVAQEREPHGFMNYAQITIPLSEWWRVMDKLRSLEEG